MWYCNNLRTYAACCFGIRLPLLTATETIRERRSPSLALCGIPGNPHVGRGAVRRGACSAKPVRGAAIAASGSPPASSQARFVGRLVRARGSSNSSAELVHPLEELMFAFVALILIVAWLMGFLVFHAAGGLIHLLLIVALVAFIYHLVVGRRRTTM